MGNGCGQCKRDIISSNEKTIVTKSKKGMEQTTGTTEFLDVFCKPPLKVRRGQAQSSVRTISIPSEDMTVYDSGRKIGQRGLLDYNRECKLQNENIGLLPFSFPTEYLANDRILNQQLQHTIFSDQQENLQITKQKEIGKAHKETLSQDINCNKVDLNNNSKGPGEHLSNTKKTRLLNSVNTKNANKPLLVNGKLIVAIDNNKKNQSNRIIEEIIPELKSEVCKNLLRDSSSQDNSSSPRGN